MSEYLNGTVSVNTAAKEVAPTGHNNDGVLIQNRGPVPVYLGGPNVTADTTSTGGLLLAPGDKVTLSTITTIEAPIYGITGAGTAYVTWIQVAD